MCASEKSNWLSGRNHISYTEGNEFNLQKLFSITLGFSPDDKTSIKRLHTYCYHFLALYSQKPGVIINSPSKQLYSDSIQHQNLIMVFVSLFVNMVSWEKLCLVLLGFNSSISSLFFMCSISICRLLYSLIVPTSVQ